MQVRMLCIAVAALTGCAAPAPMETVKVEVPVSVACVDVVPPPPELTADKVWAATKNEWERQRALRVDRERLLSHVNKLNAILSACAGKAV